MRVILASIMPVSAYHNPSAPQTVLRPMSRIVAINQWMKTYADGHGCFYLDYFSAMIDPSGLLKEELSGDDLHPNAKGYAIMAPLAQAAIERALK
jgi:lysophospholipase L1-like esterase